MPTRKIGTGFGTCSIGGTNFAADCSSATLKATVKDAEGKGITDTDDFPIPVGRSLTIDGDFMVSGSIALMGTVNSSTPIVTFIFNTSANIYTGTALITDITHKGEREGLQTFSISMKAQGGWTIT